MIGLLKRAVKRAVAGSPSHAAFKFVMKDWAPLFDLEASAEVLETKQFSPEPEAGGARKALAEQDHGDRAPSG